MILAIFFCLGLLLMLISALGHFGMHMSKLNVEAGVRSQLRSNTDMSAHERNLHWRVVRRCTSRLFNWVGSLGLLLVVVCCAVKLPQI
jgi:hypothetical protein